MLSYLLVNSSSDSTRLAVASTVTPLDAKVTASSLPMPLLLSVMSAKGALSITTVRKLVLVVITLVL